jgi:hypothetical protein
MDPTGDTDMETPQLETLQLETLQLETLQLETLQLETLQLETLQLETLQVETPQQHVRLTDPIVRFAITSITGKPQIFGFHEDAVCSSSRAFRELLQPNRKPLEGDCYICHDPFNGELDNLVWCKAECGCNFHAACVTEWLKTSKTCGNCRASWREVSTTSQRTEDHWFVSGPPGTARLAEVMGVYLHYLYYGQIRLDENIPTENDEDTTYLFKCLLLGDILQDKGFKKAILEIIVDRTREIGYHAIVEAYKQCPEGSILRKFIVDAMLSCGRYPTDIFALCPADFVKDLSIEWFKDREPDLCGEEEPNLNIRGLIEKYAADDSSPGFKIDRKPLSERQQVEPNFNFPGLFNPLFAPDPPELRTRPFGAPTPARMAALGPPRPPADTALNSFGGLITVRHNGQENRPPTPPDAQAALTAWRSMARPPNTRRTGGQPFSLADEERLPPLLVRIANRLIQDAREGEPDAEEDLAHLGSELHRPNVDYEWLITRIRATRQELDGHRARLNGTRRELLQLARDEYEERGPDEEPDYDEWEAQLDEIISEWED